MRVATYTKISTDEDHQPFSLEAQAERLGAYVTSQDGWEKVRTFTDQRSGATLERSGLQRCLTEAKAGRFDLLLVYRVDRLARSVRGLAQILEDLDAVGVAFRSATEPFDTATPAGRMMVQMLGVFAEFERATIIDRVIAGMERKAARGAWTAGSHPYGYRPEKNTGFLVAIPEEAPLVPTIFDLYARRRLGTRAVASWLNKRGYRTRSGRPWSYMAIFTILRNRTYLGELFFRGQWHKAPHEPLVSGELFDAAQLVLAERGEDYSKRRSNPSDYLLSGLVRCARCKKQYLGTAATGRSARYRYYTCYTRQRYGTERCDADRLPAEQLESAIRQSIRTTYRRHDLLAKAIAEWRAKHGTEQPLIEEQLAQVDAEMRRAEDAVERYLLAFEAGTMPEAICGDRLRALSQTIADLRCRHGELTAQLDGDSPDAVADVDLAKLGNLVDDILADDQQDLPAAKALFQQLIAGIEVASRRAIRPTFRIPSHLPAVRDVSGLVEVTSLALAHSRL
jgi:site-specific DNA recombinase